MVTTRSQSPHGWHETLTSECLETDLDIRFSDAFVEDVWSLLSTKRKKIRFIGDLSATKEEDEADGDFLSLSFSKPSSPYVVVEVRESQHVNVYLRSSAKADRGRVVCRIEGLRVVKNPRAFVDTLIWLYREADYSDCEGIRARWERIALRSAD